MTVRHWISYSSDADPVRRRRRPNRRGGRCWSWRWPWSWRGNSGTPRSPAAAGNSGRRASWPLWLLLLLLLLLALLIGGWLWYESRTTPGRPNAPTPPPYLPSGLPENLQIQTAATVPAATGPLTLQSSVVQTATTYSGDSSDDSSDAGGADPSSDSADGNGADADINDDACNSDGFVLVSDGKQRFAVASNGIVLPVANLDGAVIQALIDTDLPVDTIAMGPDADAGALEEIAQRTGGVFAKTE